MLSIMKEKKKVCNTIKLKPSDFETNVIRVTTEEEEKDGVWTIKRKKKVINLSRKINETAKLLKVETAREKLEKISKAING